MPKRAKYGCITRSIKPKARSNPRKTRTGAASLDINWADRDEGIHFPFIYLAS
jgi:hypothetical protein